MRLWLNWIEHRSSEPRVGGSSPFRRTTTSPVGEFFIADRDSWALLLKRFCVWPPPCWGWRPSPLARQRSSLHLTACPFRRTKHELALNISAYIDVFCVIFR